MGTNYICTKQPLRMFMQLTIDEALQQGIAAHKEGKAEEAERLYRAILQSQPLHPDANHNLGVLAVTFNKADAALTLFKTALEAKPNVEQFWLSYIDALIKDNQIKNAKRAIKTAKNKGCDSKKLKALLSQSKAPADGKVPSQQQLNNVLEYYQTGRFGDAEKLAISITQEFPEHPFGWKVLGAVLKQTGKKSEAVNANQKAVELSPQDAEAHNNLGVTLQELGRLEEAEASYTQAIALKSDYAEAHNNLGNTFKKLGKLEEAEASYTQAIALKPDYSTARHMLAALTGETTETAPLDYVERLFDNYAARFESSLVDNLEYRTPRVIAEMIIEDSKFDLLGSIMDLGCGTGLFGSEIKQFCEHLEGIDLSEKMLAKAKGKNVYNKLIKQDIVAYLSNTNLNFDYFISTDVFIYIGDLYDVFRLIKFRNKTGGKLAFSTEDYDGDGFFLEQSGRYSHSKKYIECLCEKFGYKLRHFETQNLRKEKNQYISGGLYLLEF